MVRGIEKQYAQLSQRARCRVGAYVSTFFDGCMRRYEGISVQNRRFRSNGGRLIQNLGRLRGRTTNCSFSQKTRLNDLSCGIQVVWTDFSSILSQFTCLTDGQTDGQCLSHRQSALAFHAARKNVRNPYT